MILVFSMAFVRPFSPCAVLVAQQGVEAAGFAQAQRRGAGCRALGPAEAGLGVNEQAQNILDALALRRCGLPDLILDILDILGVPAALDILDILDIPNILDIRYIPI